MPGVGEGARIPSLGESIGEREGGDTSELRNEEVEQEQEHVMRTCMYTRVSELACRQEFRLADKPAESSFRHMQH